MKYEYSSNIDSRGERDGRETQRKTLEQLKEEMGEEQYLEIIRKFSNNEKLEADEQALIDYLREGHLH